MPDVVRPRRGSFYRDSLAASLSTTLGAAVILSLADWLVTRSRVATGGGELLVIIAGLYAAPALCVGVLIGLVIAALRATHGHDLLETLRIRLVHDDRFDRAVTGGLMAAALVAALFAGIAAMAALALVAEVQRQETGAVLMGLTLAASIPLVGLLAWPLYRATRVAAAAIPRTRRVPRVAVVAVTSATLAVALALHVLFTQLDWRALALDSYLAIALYPVLCVAWRWLWYGPLSASRQAIPGRRAFTIAAVAVAGFLAWSATRSQPSETTAMALADASLGSRLLVTLGRSLIDRDGDGYSPFVGGPDCHDGNPSIHPGAREIPDNGLDDNCLGGDRESRPEPLDATPLAAAPLDPAPDTVVGQDAGAAPGPGSGTPVQNVILLMVDTLRADRLGVAGYRRDDRSLTPRLDELARAGSYFTRAYAQAPNTPRSLPSTFFSRYPSQLAMIRKFVNYPRLKDDNISVFEILQQHGVHTVGYASHFYFSDKRNITQGFDLFDNTGALDVKGSNRDIASPRIVPRVESKLAELARDGRRFAMFVHLFEPHSAYVTHRGLPITESGMAAVTQKYDHEIAYVDSWIGRIVDAVGATGLAETTMLVVFSDHGEAFGVHRVAGKKMYFHGQTLYDELLRVPLIIDLPGRGDVGQHDDTVMLVDIAPTVLHAMAIPSPPDFVGRSLLPRTSGQTIPPRPAYGELLPAPSWNHSAKMVVSGDGRYKLYHRSSDNRFELYDLASDPEERVDLVRARPEASAEVLATMREELIRWVEVDLP